MEPETASHDDLEFFEKQVRPILVTRCYECHSGKLAEPKGNLRLDSSDFVLAGGDTSARIVPGAAERACWSMRSTTAATTKCRRNQRLPKDEIAVLTKWVECWCPVAGRRYVNYGDGQTVRSGGAAKRSIGAGKRCEIRRCRPSHWPIGRAIRSTGSFWQS